MYISNSFLALMSVWNIQMPQDKTNKTPRRQHDAPTIAEVAQEAGVSPMTVSRVINNEDSVREKTKERVLEAIKKLNYTPNQSARNLAGARPIHIGLIYDNHSSTYLSEFLIGALEQSSQLNAQLSVEKSQDIGDAIATAKRLIERGIDGLLLPPPLSDSADVLDYLEKEEIPAIAAASGRLMNNISAVSIDDKKAAYQMTQHIISLGHTRIGFILGNPSQQASEMRFAGYKQALQEANIKINEKLIAQGFYTYRSGIEAAQKLLNVKNPPSAIFACNDDMAAATVAVAHRNHINVPSDLSVCGFDDSLMARTIWPELTTIHQPILEMSRTSVKMLVEKIRARRNKQNPSSRHLLLDFTLVRRESDSEYKT